MIIFEYNNIIFCYLINPKCGTHTFYQLYKQLNVKTIYCSESEPLSANGSVEYDNFDYFHCNLKGAIKYLELKKINVKNVVFFTTIRNPFERLLSHYWYALKFENIKKFNDQLTQQKDFNKFVLEHNHHKHFEPQKFRCEKNFKVHVLRLENWKQDLELFFKKYNFSLESLCILDTIKENQSTRNVNLTFNDEITRYIINNYEMDFVDGNYNIYPS